MTAFAQHQIDYVAWQNRSTRFYIASRLCYLRHIYAPAAYCGVISLELLLKATLVYHDRSFTPTHFGHSIVKLRRALVNKVPRSKAVELPDYFWHEDRYLYVSRYPTDGKGVGLPASFLADLDAGFAGLLKLTPFQHGTELRRILADKSGTERAALTRSNAQLRELRGFLKVRKVLVARAAGA